LVDPHIISLCCKNDRKGYKALYEATIPYVYDITKRYISQAADRQDVVQETYAKVFKYIKSYDAKKGSFNTWIRKVAVNESLTYLKQQKKCSFVMPSDIAELQPAADTININGITRPDIEKVLQHMPDGYKVVFLLNVLDDYSHKEIGKQLGITAETSRSQLLRAKKWIRKHIVSNKNNNAYGLF